MSQTGANRTGSNLTGSNLTGPDRTGSSKTWTSAFGRACGVLLDAIVRWLALARINPNVLTFLGLVVNTIAAFLFGYANGDNQARMFRYAGLVIIASGFFDLVDGQVARARNKVTRFGGFFDSVVDRYSDASQFLGLLVFYARGQRFAYVLLTAFVMISASWSATRVPAPNPSSAPAVSASWNVRSGWSWSSSARSSIVWRRFCGSSRCFPPSP